MLGRVDHGRQQLIVRVVFVGAPGAGKRSTVRWLAANAPALQRREFASDGTTLTAALVPQRCPQIGGRRLWLELVTAAGDAAEQDLAPALRGAHLAVFVGYADGRAENARFAATPALSRIPVVLQLNHADAERRPDPGEVARDLPSTHGRYTETIAAAGRGLADLFDAILDGVSAEQGAEDDDAELGDALVEEPAPARPAARQRSAPAAPGSAPAAAIAEAIRRRTTVRYYRRMNVQRNYPLLVAFSAEGIGRAGGGVQVEGRGFAIDRDRPVVTVVPVFPGCLCAPVQVPVDVSAETVQVRLWLTPLCKGKLDDARVEIWHHGRLIDQVATPARVTTHAWTRLCAAASAATPAATLLLKRSGVDVGEAATHLLPFLQSLVESAGDFGPSGALTGTLLLATAGLYLLRRARWADPVVKFFELAPA